MLKEKGYKKNYLKMHVAHPQQLNTHYTKNKHWTFINKTPK